MKKPMFEEINLLALITSDHNLFSLSTRISVQKFLLWLALKQGSFLESKKGDFLRRNLQKILVFRQIHRVKRVLISDNYSYRPR